jgi:hypothetical protein
MTPDAGQRRERSGMGLLAHKKANRGGATICLSFPSLVLLSSFTVSLFLSRSRPLLDAGRLSIKPILASSCHTASPYTLHTQELSTMKVATGAVLLALSGAAYAVPLPIGMLDNVQDSCSGMGSGCISAGPFLHHLADSETKYLHLIHPETGDVMHVIAPSNSVAAPSSSAPAGIDDDQPPAKPAAGMYPSSNHPASSTPFSEPPSLSSANGTSLSSTAPVTTADNSDKISPVQPAGTAVAPNSTLADNLASAMKGKMTPLPATSATANQTSTSGQTGDDKTTPPADLNATLNATNIADATGVAQAPNLVKVNDNSPDQKVRRREAIYLILLDG